MGVPLRSARIIHTITPGDHFSPRTGSAIPTVVHSLAAAAATGGDRRHAVVVDRATYQPRYDSADIIEYDAAPAPTGLARRADALLGRLGASRPAVARFYSPLAEALRDLPQSIVVAHNAPVMLRLLRDSHHRVVLYAHNDLLRTYSRAEAGRMLEGASAIVCVSESLAHVTRARLPSRLATRVRVVHNGADTRRFTPLPAASRTGANTPVRVLFVGRVIPEKGVDVLVRAAARVRQPDVEFVIVGSSGFARDAAPTPYEMELRTLATRSAAPIRFEPFVDRDSIPALLATADIFVVPSRWPDPCPLTVGESQAAGLPLIASRIGGIPEIAAPGSRLVAPGDPAALAASIDELVADAALRDRLSAQSRAHGESHDWAWAWSTLRNVLEGVHTNRLA